MLISQNIVLFRFVCYYLKTVKSSNRAMGFVKVVKNKAYFKRFVCVFKELSNYVNLNSRLLYWTELYIYLLIVTDGHCLKSNFALSNQKLMRALVRAPDKASGPR